jgi:hypothetical protein
MATGGDQIIGIILGGGSLIGIAYCVARLIAAVAEPDAIYGDVVNVPQELRPSRKLEGGSPSIAPGPVTDHESPHDARVNSK